MERMNGRGAQQLGALGRGWGKAKVEIFKDKKQNCINALNSVKLLKPIDIENNRLIQRKMFWKLLIAN